jgi:hypothetical protein
MHVDSPFAFSQSAGDPLSSALGAYGNVNLPPDRRDASGCG